LSYDVGFQELGHDEDIDGARSIASYITTYDSGLVVLSSEGIIQAIVLMMMDVATVSIGPNMVLDALPIPWVI
jgi:hypothetical protein